jgi:Asp-tRNA(Asn)/Glu-tRNA(Gln) amidotransferase A subunit family amidase
MQVIGRQRDDLTVLRAMAAMEDLMDFNALAQGF